jgi:uncharacterized protein
MPKGGAMTRRDATLLMLSLADGAQYSPVQIQKAMFILSRESPEIFDAGSQFDFQPYDYGPFDKDVYAEIDALSRDGLALVGATLDLRRKTYAASDQGRRAAEGLRGRLSQDQLAFAQKVSSFVRRLSFADLVSAIYKAYPEMQENSVFVGG